LRLEPRFPFLFGLIQFSLHGPSALLDTLIIRIRLIEKQRIV